MRRETFCLQRHWLYVGTQTCRLGRSDFKHHLKCRLHTPAVGPVGPAWFKLPVSHASHGPGAVGPLPVGGSQPHTEDAIAPWAQAASWPRHFTAACCDLRGSPNDDQTAKRPVPRENEREPLRSEGCSLMDKARASVSSKQKYVSGAVT